MNCKTKWGRIITVVFFLGICLTFSARTFAGDSTLLNVGDKIPELKYDKWLKGTPINGYEKGRLYVFEFWATWCGPCRQAMPHLSEVAAKYKDRLTVVGVDIWENDENHHATITPEKFVKQMGDNMAYNVVTDTKDQWMGNKWMKAAGQEGIPCSFMVKDGVILWIGHPINLDSVIEVVNSGRYDPVAVQKEFKEKAAREQEREAAMHKVLDPVDSAEKAQNWMREFQLIDAGKKEMPVMGGYLDFKRFCVLLDHFSEDTAMTFLKPWQATNPGFTASSAAVIFQKKGLSKDFYLYGVELAKKAMETAPQAPPAIFQEMMAHGYEAAGEYGKAVEIQQTALDGAKDAVKNGKFKGMIGDDTVEKMEKELAEYKSHLK